MLASQRTTSQTTQQTTSSTGSAQQVDVLGNEARQSRMPAPDRCEAEDTCGSGDLRGGVCYEVQPGDTLASIAEATYGDASQWTAIVDANPDTVHEGNVLVVGEVLDLPQLCVDEVDQCTEPDPAATSPAVSRADWFAQLVSRGEVDEALDLLVYLEPDTLEALGQTPSVQAGIALHFSLSEAVFALDTLQVDVLAALTSYHSPGLEQALSTCDPIVAELLGRTPGGAELVRTMVPDNALFAAFLFGYSVAPHEQVLLAGFDMTARACSSAPLDADLLVRICSNFTQAERREVLLALRAAGEWEQLVAGLGAEHVALIQGWLGEDVGDGTGQTLAQRRDAAVNSARGRDAQARVDAVAATDTHTPRRLTPRLVELLVLGVALPRLEGSDLATEGVLGAVQAERAAKALLLLPDQEYMRTLMLLELSGDSARLTQSFLMLKGLAARLDQLTDADATNDNARALEGFSDDVRGWDRETCIEQTSVTQQTSTSPLGMQQRFTMSCNVTSGVVIRAEADPIEALSINQTGQRDIQNLDGSVARETERGLENHGGNVAIARDPSGVTGDVNSAIAALTGTAPAADLAAVQRYMANLPYTQANYDAGIAAVRTHLAMSGYPNDQAMRLVRETAGGGSTPGIDDTELAGEMNGGLNVDGTTGQTAASDWDSVLWGLFTADNNGDGVADRLLPTPVPAAWTTRVDGLLDRAEPKLESGVDVAFNVYWHGGGGHTMSFTNVRIVGGVRSFLVHDTWTGNTTWVSDADIQQGNWPGVSARRGLICGVIG